MNEQIYTVLNVAWWAHNSVIYFQMPKKHAKLGGVCLKCVEKKTQFDQYIDEMD